MTISINVQHVSGDKEATVEIFNPVSQDNRVSNTVKIKPGETHNFTLHDQQAIRVID